MTDHATQIKFWRQSDWWIFLGIFFVGAFFRFYLLAQIPPGLYPDEAMNGNNALEALQNGAFKVFYPENNGREGLFINIQAVSIFLFGNEAWALRFVSAIFGTLTILGIYLLAKELFENEDSKSEIPDPEASNLGFKISYSQTIALFSAFFLAANFWHINFSRIGFRAITVPFFAVFALYFLLRGLRKENMLAMALAGILTGLGLYGYLAFRFFPFILAVPLIIFFWKWIRSGFWDKNLSNEGEEHSLTLTPKNVPCGPCFIGIFALAFIVTVTPLLIYFLDNPQDFFGRTSQVSVMSSGNPLLEFLKSNGATAQMFFYQGDCNWRHNLPCEPELHPIISFFFLAGVFVGIGELFRKQGTKTNRGESSLSRRSIFLILFSWIFFMSLPATLTREGLPHALRAIGLIPPVIILAGLGAGTVFSRIKERFEAWSKKWPENSHRITRIGREVRLLIIIILLFVPVTVYKNYFLEWSSNPETYFSFGTDLWHLGQYLQKEKLRAKKYVIVNLSGVEVRGIPMPAQTVMFATDTFTPEDQAQKKLTYILQDELSKIQIQPQEKTVIGILNGMDTKLVRDLKSRFPSLRQSIPGDFVILETE